MTLFLCSAVSCCNRCYQRSLSPSVDLSVRTSTLHLVATIGQNLAFGRTFTCIQ